MNGLNTLSNHRHSQHRHPVNKYVYPLSIISCFGKPTQMGISVR